MPFQTHLGRLCAGALIAAVPLAACGGPGTSSRAGQGTCSERVPGLTAATLRYRVESTPTQAGTFEETRAALCSRLRRLGLRGFSVTEARGVLALRVRRAEQEDGRMATASGSIAVFDWDANAQGSSGPDVPFSGGHALFDAVRAAARRAPRAVSTDVVPGAPTTTTEEADRQNDSQPFEHQYLFGPDGQLLAGPAYNEGALAAARASAAPGARLMTVPRGILVVEAERAAGQAEGYLVLEDDAELTRADIADPSAPADQATRKPVVRFSLSDKGRQALQSATERIAQRSLLQGAPAASSTAQRLAIALDDRVVSLSTIDPQASLQGPDGSKGIQIGGVGTRAQARRLALLLRDKPLPGHLVPLAPPP